MRPRPRRQPQHARAPQALAGVAGGRLRVLHGAPVLGQPRGPPGDGGRLWRIYRRRGAERGGDDGGGPRRGAEAGFNDVEDYAVEARLFAQLAARGAADVVRPVQLALAPRGAAEAQRLPAQVRPDAGRRADDAPPRQLRRVDVDPHDRRRAAPRRLVHGRRRCGAAHGRRRRAAAPAAAAAAEPFARFRARLRSRATAGDRRRALAPHAPLASAFCHGRRG
mmetsp:Transcript_24634/g.84316  ORF Transcript_24634/g.84316 Transcript_24634/m.84316 type:complete len:222 (-) Transcript_24634:35-700(-)